jgi:guanine deaminase
MHPPSLTIAGSLLLPQGERSVRLADACGHVVTEGDRLRAVDPVRPSPAPDLGDEGCIVIPAFTDCHLHLPQFDVVGVDGLELLDWLEKAVFPAEMKWADVDFARGMAARVADELLSFGTTAVAAYGTSHFVATQAAIDTLAAKGLSGHVGQSLMDRNGPAALLVPAPAALSQAASLRPKGRISPAVTPRFAVACSDALLAGCGTLAKRTGWLVQTHLAETIREIETMRGLHPGLTYTQVYDRAGLLTPRTILGHGIHLDDADRTLLAERGAAVAHCPAANRFLDAGEMDLSRHEARGVRTCLGSDVGAGPDRSMVRVARAMIDAAKQVARGRPERRGDFPRAAEAWWRITAGNARAIGLMDRGTLTPGNDADLLVVRPTKPWRDSPDPLSTLLYAWDDRWIEAVVSQGAVRYDAR